MLRLCICVYGHFVILGVILTRSIVYLHRWCRILHSFRPWFGPISTCEYAHMYPPASSDTAIGNPRQKLKFCPLPSGYDKQFAMARSTTFKFGKPSFSGGHGFHGHASSTAHGGGGSFQNWKPIGEVGCCDSGMAERSH
jgi:hypothetical protein